MGAIFKVPFQVPNQQSQRRHVHGPDIKMKNSDENQHQARNQILYNFPTEITLEISGGFLGIIPPYFFVIAAS